MSKQKKPTASEEIESIEDALVDSILNASGQELRDEIAAAGIDPDACVAEVGAAIASAKAAFAKQRLDDARAELSAWRTHGRTADSAALAGASARLQRLRSGDRELDSKMLLAARKGAGMSDSDLEGLLEDMAELERMAREDSGE